MFTPLICISLSLFLSSTLVALSCSTGEDMVALSGLESLHGEFIYFVGISCLCDAPNILHSVSLTTCFCRWYIQISHNCSWKAGIIPWSFSCYCPSLDIWCHSICISTFALIISLWFHPTLCLANTCHRFSVAQIFIIDICTIFIKNNYYDDLADFFGSILWVKASSYCLTSSVSHTMIFASPNSTILSAAIQRYERVRVRECECEYAREFVLVREWESVWVCECEWVWVCERESVCVCVLACVCLWVYECDCVLGGITTDYMFICI